MLGDSPLTGVPRARSPGQGCRGTSQRNSPSLAGSARAMTPQGGSKTSRPSTPRGSITPRAGSADASPLSQTADKNPRRSQTPRATPSKVTRLSLKSTSAFQITDRIQPLSLQPSSTGVPVARLVSPAPATERPVWSFRRPRRRSTFRLAALPVLRLFSAHKSLPGPQTKSVSRRFFSLAVVAGSCCSESNFGINICRRRRCSVSRETSLTQPA